MESLDHQQLPWPHNTGKDLSTITASFQSQLSYSHINLVLQQQMTQICGQPVFYTQTPDCLRWDAKMQSRTGVVWGRVAEMEGPGAARGAPAHLPRECCQGCCHQHKAPLPWTAAGILCASCHSSARSTSGATPSSARCRPLTTQLVRSSKPQVINTKPSVVYLPILGWLPKGT